MSESIIFTQTIRSIDFSESQLELYIDGIKSCYKKTTIALYAKDDGVDIKVAHKSITKNHATTVVENTVSLIKSKLSEYL